MSTGRATLKSFGTRYTGTPTPFLRCDLATGADMTILARKLSLLTVLIFGIGSAPLCAQVQAINGSIQGDVTDKGGAQIPEAAVEADEIDTQTPHREVTDGTGHFVFPSLLPGRYGVKISKPGFATTIQGNMSLTVGRALL